MESGLTTRGANLDDVWELDIDDSRSHRLDTAELEREWQARHSQFHNLGYRDGIDAGKNSTVQEGFNLGFKEAAAAGYNWGVCKGAISAYTLLPISTQAALVVDEDARARLQALQSVMGSFSTVDALRHYYEDTIQPSLGETSSQSMQPVADMEGVADALRGLSISRVNASTTPNGAHSGSISRLEELERRTRSELKSHSIELSILN